MDGTGTLVLDAQNTFTGGITINSGTVELATQGAAGTGRITFDPGRWNSRRLGADSKIDNFGPNDHIVIADFEPPPLKATEVAYQTGPGNWSAPG